MPYNKIERRKLLDKDLKAAVDVGDLNYVYTAHVIIPIWVFETRYKTIEKIRALMNGDETNSTVVNIDMTFRKKGWTDKQVKRAKELAFDEFYRRVGVNYENNAARKNGDVYEGVPFAESVTTDIDVSPSLIKRQPRKKEKAHEKTTK